MTGLRRPLILALLWLTACAGGGNPSPAERDAIASAVRARLVDATELGRPGVVERMLSLYPDSGRVISASSGRMTSTHDSLAAGIAEFWNNVGQNMREPRWVWGPMAIDVLGPDAAAVTATYRIPHRTPQGSPHEIGGAWTAVFARRDGRWVVIQEHLSDASR